MTSGGTKISRLPDRFSGANLTDSLRRLEDAVNGLSVQNCKEFLKGAGINRGTLAAAAELKQLAGQIDVTIHALGILSCLPHILEADEVVEYVSLGAGNTGRQHDLETNRRIAEFKFICWRGGAEAIRQNSIFKDFFQLAENPTPREKQLFLLGTQHALKFLRGGRALKSVLSRNAKIQRIFFERFGNQFRTVGEYFAVHGDQVEIVDVSTWVSELT